MKAKARDELMGAMMKKSKAANLGLQFLHSLGEQKATQEKAQSKLTAKKEKLGQMSSAVGTK